MHTLLRVIFINNKPTKFYLPKLHFTRDELLFSTEDNFLRPICASRSDYLVTLHGLFTGNRNAKSNMTNALKYNHTIFFIKNLFTKAFFSKNNP